MEDRFFRYLQIFTANFQNLHVIFLVVKQVNVSTKSDTNYFSPEKEMLIQTSYHPVNIAYKNILTGLITNL